MSVPETLQWAPYTSATGSSKTASGTNTGPIGDRVQEPTEVRFFDPLPGQTESDVERLDDLAPPGLVGHQDGAVSSAAGEDDEISRHGIRPGIRSPRCRSLAPRPAESSGSGGLKAVPDPPGQDLARRVVESFYLVEVVVVEASQERLNRARQVGEVTDPTGVITDRSAHVHGHPVGVPVQPSALVARRHVREAVSRLERELSEDLHQCRVLHLARL